MELNGIQGNKSRINTNSYATKKTVSQGLFDVALLTANASQLKHTLTLGDESKFYLLMIILITASIMLQVLVGILFIYLGYHNIDNKQQQKRLNNLNNITTILVFIITVINVFISGFGININQSNM
ncbi:Ninjurin-1-like protein [Euroglyphus maynei]|uniref:Ninjurin-1-like protein n=1 Tax=Euroglyphus maynei TaxID=6958 RepID=A0A1Y3BUS8_EURMA|nr:Ninjurin-1-like protein [Euroglyphus maynei]